jgi:hypothetical protein
VNVQEEAQKALNCLFIAIDERIAKDVAVKMQAAFAEKDAQIAKLKKSFLQTEESRMAWLSEFDNYRKRLAEARVLIGCIGWTSSERTDVIMAAEKWLAGEEPMLNPEWLKLSADANALPSQDSCKPINIGQPPP